MDVENEKQWDMGKRWTAALIEDGYTPVPNAFLTHYRALKISAPEAMLILHLMSHKWGKDNPFPSFARISRLMKVSETAARGHARSLQNKGLINRIKRPGRTNEFDLTPLFQKLEGAVAATAAKSGVG
jgi:DNA-binding MarR family transcriptional regulator